ncbi:hypothetical protein DFJ63DRAFT_314853 [Scheffersomyces coipomensis]|uniref:uncharacterized protein n=1 Tax=Scheffersomyces coipomensis TaxID=1788519 RepID=UPI00315D6BD5
MTRLLANENKEENSSFNGGSTVFNTCLSINYAVTMGLILNNKFSVLSITYIIGMMILLAFLCILSLEPVYYCQHPGRFSDNLFELRNFTCSCTKSLMLFFGLLMLIILVIVNRRSGN